MILYFCHFHYLENSEKEVGDSLMPLVGNPAPDFKMESTKDLETPQRNRKPSDYKGNG